MFKTEPARDRQGDTSVFKYRLLSPLAIRKGKKTEETESQNTTQSLAKSWSALALIVLTQTNSSLNRDLLHQAKMKGLSLSFSLSQGTAGTQHSLRCSPRASIHKCYRYPSSSHSTDQRGGGVGGMGLSYSQCLEIILRYRQKMLPCKVEEKFLMSFSVKRHETSLCYNSFFFSTYTIKESELSSLSTLAPFPFPSTTKS